MQTQSDVIKAAIDKAGSQAALARILGVKSPTVAQWALPNESPHFRPIPIRHCLKVSELAGVSVDALLPAELLELISVMKRKPKKVPA